MKPHLLESEQHYPNGAPPYKQKKGVIQLNQRRDGPWCPQIAVVGIRQDNSYQQRVQSLS